MNAVTRRNFVKHTSAAAGIAAAYSWQPSKIIGANEKINIGSIGIKSQGWGVTNNFIKTKSANIAALCDIDSEVLEEKADAAESRQGTRPEEHSDYRKIIENKEIDAVVIATPDHWHAIIAIEAMKAGKDVYIEKPCAHNITECRAIAAAAKKYNRIVQHGTQQRSGKHFQDVKDYVKSGELGKLSMARTWGVLGRNSIGKAKPEPAPEHINPNNSYKSACGNRKRLSSIVKSVD